MINIWYIYIYDAYINLKLINSLEQWAKKKCEHTPSLLTFLP